jgi:hypothetical protein
MTGIERCDYVGRLRDCLLLDDIAHAFLVLSCRYICERHLTPSQILASTSRTDAGSPAGPHEPTFPAGYAPSHATGYQLTSSQILASTSRTDAANHLPPLAVGIPRSLRALAMARSEVAPLACSSVITGARSAARAAATFNAGLAKRVRYAGAIADQAAGHGKFAAKAHDGQRIACS